MIHLYDYIGKNLQIELEQWGLKKEYHYVRGLKDIQYTTINNKILFKKNKHVELTTALLIYLTSNSTIILNNKEYYIDFNKLIEMYNMFIHLNFFDIEIEVDEETFVYAENAIAFLIDSEHADDFWLNEVDY